MIMKGEMRGCSTEPRPWPYSFAREFLKIGRMGEIPDSLPVAWKIRNVPAQELRASGG